MRDFELRRWHENDIPGLIALATANGSPVDPDALRQERAFELGGTLGLFVRVVAERRGGIVATGFARRNVFGPAGWLSVGVQVDGRQRGHGVGTEVLHAMEEEMRRGAAIGLEARIPGADTDTCAWTIRRGFRVVVNELECVLDLGGHAAVDEPDDLPAEISFRSWTGLPVAQGCDLTARLLGQMHGEEDFEWRRGAVEQFLTHRIRIVPEASWIAIRGEEALGVTISACHGAGDLFTWFTAVDHRWRRHHLATTLKHRAVDAARPLGAARMLTQVAATNTPMLALNRSLGFVVTDSVPVLRKGLDSGQRTSRRKAAPFPLTGGLRERILRDSGFDGRVGTA